MKLCECGCGEPAPLAKQTRRGVSKGQPQRFIRGHAMRTYSREALGPDDYVVEARGYSSPCWIRLGHLSTRGYTKVTIAGRTMLAHRAMYEQEVGPIPDGLVLDHLCRQRDCIRPLHLEPTTDVENKRRGNGTKLTPELVAAIRADTRSQRKVAADYGVSPSHVCRIRAGSKWAP